MKILISDKIALEGIQILKAVREFKVDCKFGLSPEQLKSIVKGYDALIIRSTTKVTAEIIEAADKLKFIGRAGVGIDNVDLKAATKKGIVVMNTPGGNTTSTAEQTMSLILALSRNIPQACASLKSGKWERSKFTGVELYGKKLGIIGLGRIGATVARMAKSFGMELIGYDPFLAQELAAQIGVELVEFEDLMKQADYITIHVPKSIETKSLISDKEFEIMKNDVRIINCARGGIVDEQALVRALETDRIKGCAVDVYEKEPPDFNSPLFKFDNCVATPHLGASTSEAQVNVAVEIANVIKNALLGQGISNATNFPSVDAQVYKILEPYIELADQMGKFAGQLINGRVEKIKIIYNGVFCEQKVAPVSMSLVYGVLLPALGENINVVNAFDVAKDRAVKIEEISSNDEQEFVNLIRLEITTDKEPFSLWGTLSSNNKPRIVKIDNVYVEASPLGHIIVINNNDQPGIVGAVGTVLAREDINIASITFGRESKGGLAISVVNIDSEAPQRVIEELQKIKNILFVKLIKV
ncbi:MAG: phosphoglycerate dehydrogenase [Candidatus Aceula meridiana]|nr:phosphoglycerate dehydrogenase [Candidatus Aceula meridiana]